MSVPCLVFMCAEEEVTDDLVEQVEKKLEGPTAQEAADAVGQAMADAFKDYMNPLSLPRTILKVELFKEK